MTALVLQIMVSLALGAAMGSFLTVVAARLPALVLEDRGLAVTARRALVAVSWPGSHCGACRTPIAWRDNIPVLSYILLQGRCRACGQKYEAAWVLEALTAMAAIFCVARWGWTGEALLLFAFLSLLLILSAIDVAEQLLPDVLIVPLALLGLAAAQMHGTLVAGLASAALAGSLLWGIGALFRIYAGQDGMGFGDVKLAAALGLWLAPETLPFFLVAAFGGGLLFQARALLRRQADGGTAVPFGPFLCASAALFILFPEAALYLQAVLAGG